jgi:ankyrin repeat protein
MDGEVLKAAVTGDARLMKDLASYDPSVRFGSTPQGNTCLHIASIHGHQGFCKDVLTLNQSLPLLNAINADGETPLLTAVARGRATLASVLLRFCRDQQLSETILKQDKRGFNVLHHAVLRGHRKLALELIEAEPALSKAVNKFYESPMYTAVMRNYWDVLEKLLEIPDAAHEGAHGCNALHAAVTSDNAGETYASHTGSEIYYFLHRNLISNTEYKFIP